jgi:hypothetical protein
MYINWVKYVYQESGYICVYIGMIVYDDMHNNLVGPIKLVEFRIVHFM